MNYIKVCVVYETITTTGKTFRSWRSQQITTPVLPCYYLAQLMGEACCIFFARLVAKSPTLNCENMIDLKFRDTSVEFGQATSSGFSGGLISKVSFISQVWWQKPLSPLFAPGWKNGRIVWTAGSPNLTGSTPAIRSNLGWKAVCLVVLRRLCNLP